MEVPDEQPVVEDAALVAALVALLVALLVAALDAALVAALVAVVVDVDVPVDVDVVEVVDDVVDVVDVVEVDGGIYDASRIPLEEAIAEDDSLSVFEAITPPCVTQPWNGVPLYDGCASIEYDMSPTK